MCQSWVSTACRPHDSWSESCRGCSQASLLAAAHVHGAQKQAAVCCQHHDVLSMAAPRAQRQAQVAAQVAALAVGLPAGACRRSRRHRAADTCATQRVWPAPIACLPFQLCSRCAGGKGCDAAELPPDGKICCLSAVCRAGEGVANIKFGLQVAHLCCCCSLHAPCRGTSHPSNRQLAIVHWLLGQLEVYSPHLHLLLTCQVIVTLLSAGKPF